MADLRAASQRLESALGCGPLIRAHGKNPFEDDWPTGPHDDPDEWRDRLDGHIGNVAMVCGFGLVVVDGDIYKPGAEDSLDALIADTGLTRDTVTAVTGGGGRHLVYRYDPALTVPSVPLEPRGYPGIEIKADGGCIIVEPSIHESGNPYLWEEMLAPGVVDVAEATSKFLALVGAIEGDGRSTRWRSVRDTDEIHDDDIEVIRLLCEHFGGHDPQRLRNGILGVYRPGKDRGSLSATVGYIGVGVAKIWTDSWPPFTANQVIDLGKLRRMTGEAPTVDLSATRVTFPEGTRLWTPDDVDEVPVPLLDRAAYHGPVGTYLDLVNGQTEAHPAAIGIVLLSSFGTLIGRRAQYFANPITHHCNIYAAVVGPTSSGGKGVADTVAMVLVKRVCPNFEAVHAWGGLGSGEVMVRELADPDPDDDKAPPVEKRRIVMDAELSAVLRAIRRDGSILGENLRKAFDYGPLRHRTVMLRGVTAVGHHVAVLGAITPDELVSLVDEVSIANGLINRFLLIHSEIVDRYPFGGHIDPAKVEEIAATINLALRILDTSPSVNGSTILKLSDDARAVWSDFYRARRTGVGVGILASLTARQVAHAARLALIYAVLDGTPVITASHVRAAVAWCDYSVETAQRIFGDGVVGRHHQLIEAVREAGANGITAGDLHRGVARKWKPGELVRIRDELVFTRVLHVHRTPGAGRPTERYFAITKAETDEEHAT